MFDGPIQNLLKNGLVELILFCSLEKRKSLVFSGAFSGLTVQTLFSNLPNLKELILIDKEIESLEVSREFGAKHDLDLMLSDLDDLSLESNSVDLFLSLNPFTDKAPSLKVIREIRRVLKENGKFSFLQFENYNESSFFKPLLAELFSQTGHIEFKQRMSFNCDLSNFDKTHDIDLELQIPSLFDFCVENFPEHKVEKAYINLTEKYANYEVGSSHIFPVKAGIYTLTL